MREDVPYILYTKAMSPEERALWWKNNASVDYRRYRKTGKTDEEDMGEKMNIPQGKIRCHGLRSIKKESRMMAENWYLQSPTRIKEQLW